MSNLITITGSIDQKSKIVETHMYYSFFNTAQHYAPTTPHILVHLHNTLSQNSFGVLYDQFILDFSFFCISIIILFNHSTRSVNTAWQPMPVHTANKTHNTTTYQKWQQQTTMHPCTLTYSCSRPLFLHR